MYVSVCEGVCVFVFVCQQGSSFGVGRLRIFGNSCTEIKCEKETLVVVVVNSYIENNSQNI